MDYSKLEGLTDEQVTEVANIARDVVSCENEYIRVKREAKTIYIKYGLLKMITCKACGETMTGDGHTVAYHCPNVDVDELCLEPDAEPVECEHEDNEMTTPFDSVTCWVKGCDEPQLAISLNCKEHHNENV